MKIFYSIFLVLLIEGFTRTVISSNVARSTEPIIRISNMTKPMEATVVRICKEAFARFNGYSKNSRSSIALQIRSQLDRNYGPQWQCILGLDYALSIVSEDEKRIILDLGKVAILIFKGKC